VKKFVNLAEGLEDCPFSHEKTGVVQHCRVKKTRSLSVLFVSQFFISTPRPPIVWEIHSRITTVGEKQEPDLVFLSISEYRKYKAVKFSFPPISSQTFTAYVSSFFIYVHG
jgi:hypothetical protein